VADQNRWDRSLHLRPVLRFGSIRLRTYLHTPLGLALQAKQSSLAVFLQPIVLSRSRSLTLTRMIMAWLGQS
jgi:hypothetical protein